MEIGEARRHPQRRLRPVRGSAASDARLLLADTLGTTTSWVLAHDREALTLENAEAFDGRVSRCASGEPLPYVLGWWEFYGRRFAVGPAVLIPRPETELLVEAALRELENRPGSVRLVDVGSGSGCVAVTLAAELAGLRVVATDVSRAALQVARDNAQAHRVAGRLRLVQADLLEGVGGAWDVVCANLPYLASKAVPRLKTNSVSRRNRVCQSQARRRLSPPRAPSVALDGGLRGTEVTRRLIESLGRQLAPGGLALLEIDEGQATELCGLVRSAVGGAAAGVRVDLAGRERLLAIRRPHAA